MHAKMIVSDDEHALVGTVNFDFRSFYLQYENAVWFCNSPIVSAVRDDFAKTLLLCKEISYGDWKKRPWYQKVAGAGLRLFSTLM
jgi:cardiolipin synthase